MTQTQLLFRPVLLPTPERMGLHQLGALYFRWFSRMLKCQTSGKLPGGLKKQLIHAIFPTLTTSPPHRRNSAVASKAFPFHRDNILYKNKEFRRTSSFREQLEISATSFAYRLRSHLVVGFLVPSVQG